MRRPDTIIIERRAYSWRALLELRWAQLDAWCAAQAEQPALFELRDDARPKAERTADGRYTEPTLLALLQGGDREGGENSRRGGIPARRILLPEEKSLAPQIVYRPE